MTPAPAIGEIYTVPTAPVAMAANTKTSLTTWTAPADGWLHAVAINGVAATTPPGRYWGDIWFVSGAQNVITRPLFNGYIADGEPVGDQPGLAFKAGDKVMADVAAGTKGGSSDKLQLVVTWSPDTPPFGSFFVLKEPGTGPGEDYDVTLAQPAAGADYATYVIPTGVRVIKEGFSGQLVTSATVANRLLRIESENTGGVPVSVAMDGWHQVASTTVTRVASRAGYSPFAQPVSNAYATGTIGMIPLGDELLKATDQIVFSTTGLDTGDQWSAGVLRLREWAMPQP